MRKFIEEYGTVILTVLAIVALIFVLGPLGNLISEGVKGNVNSMAGGVNSGLPEGGGGGPTYSYTVKAVSESGKIIDEYLLTYGQGTTNIVKPKEYTGYIKPVSQKVEWNTEDKTIEFVYDLIDYQLLVDLDDGVSESGTVIPTVYTIESDPIRLPSDLKKGSEEFVGYSGTGLTVPSKNVTIPTGSSGNRTYMANYETVEYINVQFDSRGGQTYDPVSIVKGSSLDSLPAPSREGYEFVGWFDGYDQVSTSTKFDKNTQLVAKWKAIHMSVNVIHRSSVSKNVLKTSTVEYDYGQKVTVKALTFTGYKSPSDYTFTAGLSKDDIILEYTPITYNIAYTLNGGSVSGNPSTYTIESSAITLKNPTKVGSEFLGWTGSNGSTPNKAITIPTGSTGDKSYSANFKLNEYTITYKSNGGTGADIKDTVKYGDNYLVQNNLFTRDGFKFIGWNTQADGNGEDWSAKAGTTLKWTYEKNVVLYAQWKEITYELVDGPTVNHLIQEFVKNHREINEISSIVFTDAVYDGWDDDEYLLKGLDSDGDGGVVAWISGQIEPYKVVITESPYDEYIPVITAGSGSGTPQPGTLYISTQKPGKKVIANTDSSNMFDSFNTVSFIDIANLDTKNVTNMAGMFQNVGISLNVTNFSINGIESLDVSNVKSFSSMFYNCAPNATSFELDLSKWNVSNAENLSWMFRWSGKSATNWTIGDISSWDTSKVWTMNSMFALAGENASNEVNTSITIKNSNTNTDQMFTGSFINIKDKFIVRSGSEECFQVAENAASTNNVGADGIDHVVHLGPNEYLIDFNLNGGQATDVLPFKYSSIIGLNLPTLTKTGHLFKGWSITLADGLESIINEIPAGYVGNLSLDAIFESTAPTLESLGFKNIPEGNWTIKTGTFPGFSEDVIPLTINGYLKPSFSHSNMTWNSEDKTSSSTLNGKTSLYTKMHFYFSIGRSGVDAYAETSAYGIFAPIFYDFDLMATQNNVKSGTVTSWLENDPEASELGFINVPEGKWTIKTGTFPGYSKYVIPLTMNMNGRASYGHSNATMCSLDGYGSTTLNGRTVMSLKAHGYTRMCRSKMDGYNESSIYNVFIPYFYDFDLTNLQNSNPSGGTITSWLEKEDTSTGLGFDNVPEGNWMVKSSIKGDVFPGISENIIPIAMNHSASNGDAGHWGSDNTQPNWNGSTSATLNGAHTVSASSSKGRGGRGISASVSGSNLFIPWFYEMDLTATQKGIKGGSITVWLEKQDGVDNYGFTNVPEGDWQIKSTSKGSTFPGFSEDAIPIAANIGSSSSHWWDDNSQMGFSGHVSNSINGRTSVYGGGSKAANIGSQYYNVSGTAYSVFLPAYYNFDLTEVQNNIKSGSITVWLQRRTK